MPLVDQRSFYEILAISPRASPEEIDKACVDLWYRYQPMRSTLLWKDLSRYMEQIRCTLLDPDAREAYDRLLLEIQSTSVSIPEHKAASEDLNKLATSRYMEEERRKNHLTHERKAKFSKVCYFIAVASALLFNRMIDWMNPQTWSDMTDIGWLSVFSGLATAGLAWSVIHLLPMQVATVTEK